MRKAITWILTIAFYFIEVKVGTALSKKSDAVVGVFLVLSLVGGWLFLKDKEARDIKRYGKRAAFLKSFGFIAIFSFVLGVIVHPYQFAKIITDLLPLGKVPPMHLPKIPEHEQKFAPPVGQPPEPDPLPPNGAVNRPTPRPAPGYRAAQPAPNPAPSESLSDAERKQRQAALKRQLLQNQAERRAQGRQASVTPVHQNPRPAPVYRDAQPAPSPAPSESLSDAERKQRQAALKRQLLQNQAERRAQGRQASVTPVHQNPRPAPVYRVAQPAPSPAPSESLSDAERKQRQAALKRQLLQNQAERRARSGQTPQGPYDR